MHRRPAGRGENGGTPGRHAQQERGYPGSRSNEPASNFATGRFWRWTTGVRSVEVVKTCRDFHSWGDVTVGGPVVRSGTRELGAIGSFRSKLLISLSCFSRSLWGIAPVEATLVRASLGLAGRILARQEGKHRLGEHFRHLIGKRHHGARNLHHARPRNGIGDLVGNGTGVRIGRGS